MTNNEIITFILSGDYAIFKKPWCNNQQQSYFIPPKTSMMGLIGGILGIPKNQYLKKLNFDEISIGITILERPTKDLNGYNYMHGKNLRDILKKLSNPYRNPTNKGSLSPTRVEYLKGVAYRIFLHFKDNKLEEQFFNLISNQKCYYPPFLGQVNLFANLEKPEILKFNNSEEKEYVGTVAPTELVDMDYISQSIYHVEKMPYKFSEERTHPRYISIAFFDEPEKRIKIVANRECDNNYIIGEVELNQENIGVILY